MSKIPQLNILSGETISRKRFDSVGEYVGGRYTKGTEELLENIHASVQPPSGNSMVIKQATEGQKLEDVIVVYCELDTFRAADDNKNLSADIIIYEGDNYEVKQVTHRRGRRLRHDEVVAVRESLR